MEDYDGPLIVNLPLLEAVSCKQRACDSLTVNNVREVDAATTTDTNGDASVSEDTECNVSITGSDADKQEWSFTLYDFDGQGNITKEGLATLLKTLYDAVGTTVNKQRQNTKSLRLRLTLSPDSSKVAAKSAATAAEKKEQGTAAATAGGFSKAAAAHLAASSPAERRFASKELKVKMNNLLQSEKSNIERMRRSRPDVVTRHNVVSQAQARRTVTKDTLGQESALVTSADNEKKNVNCVAAVVSDSKTNDVSNNRRMMRSRKCVSHFENPDRRNYYLDLAGVENTAYSTPAACAAETGVAAAVGLASPRISRQQGRRNLQAEAISRQTSASDAAHSSEQHQCPLQQDSGDTRCMTSSVSPQDNSASGSNECAEESCTHCEQQQQPAKHAHRLRFASSCGANARVREQVATGCSVKTTAATATTANTAAAEATTAAASAGAGLKAEPHVLSSHYHHRHKNRERNQTRAMRQVMEWLEDASKAALLQREVVVIQRHEHHHVHEYHHHHYHHYAEK